MNNKVILNEYYDGTIAMNELRRGDIGVVVGGQYSGVVVVGVYVSGLDGPVAASLTDGDTWTNRCTVRVRRLRPGTMLRIIVGEKDGEV